MIMFEQLKLRYLQWVVNTLTTQLYKNKKLLEELEMSKSTKINLNENEVLINGNKMSEAEVIMLMQAWVRKSFIFRNDEIYLPKVSAPPFNIKGTDLESFKEKQIGKVSALEYMLYTAFQTGYQAGIETNINNTKVEGKKISDELAGLIADDLIKQVFANLDDNSTAKVLNAIDEKLK